MRRLALVSSHIAVLLVLSIGIGQETFGWQQDDSRATVLASAQKDEVGQKPGDTVAAVADKTMRNSLGMEFVLIPSGEFQMGAEKPPETLIKIFRLDKQEAFLFSDEYPQHRVRITKPFYLGKYNVTVAQFRKFIQETDYLTDAQKAWPRSEAGGGGDACFPNGSVGMGPKYTWLNPGFPQKDEYPVVNVSWNDAVAFCRWLSAKEGEKYRLPTEAEWEYACRAGSVTLFTNGDNPEELVEVANIADGTVKENKSWQINTKPVVRSAITAKDGFLLMAPVGNFKPNAWGLFDMHGNAAQLCADLYDDKYYEVSPTDDPTGPPENGEQARAKSDSGKSPYRRSPHEVRAVRGSSFDSVPEEVRSARRSKAAADCPMHDVGFRIALTKDPG